MRVQLWSYLYAPEPTGIGPVSALLARLLRDRGHEVEVVAAHPHYPEPRWGVRRLPYRDEVEGINVLRLPLWVGRSTAARRIRQELTFTGSLSAALPFLGRPDVVVAASPSFPALLPAVLNARIRRVPLVLWLHDLLPDGAVATGLVREGRVLRASRWLERTAYANADRIVVLSRNHFWTTSGRREYPRRSSPSSMTRPPESRARRLGRVTMSTRAALRPSSALGTSDTRRGCPRWCAPLIGRRNCALWALGS